MIIARIVGTVVATQKDARLEGRKLLIVRPINLDGTDTSGYVVAVDTVGAGVCDVHPPARTVGVGVVEARLGAGRYRDEADAFEAHAAATSCLHQA